MEPYVRLAFVVIAIVAVWPGACCASELASLRSETTAVEPRYDRYYDIFGYWWPWFSDLSTVIMIKLKIWIILVAMLVFGDGYYWSKTSGPSIFEKSQWAQGPGWGRRKRRSIEQTDAADPSLAEQIFDSLDISDDTCRKWVVCELYLEAKRVPAVWQTLNSQGAEVFRAYRSKSTTLTSSAECRKHYPCSSMQQQRDQAADEEDWRWPRYF
ncbi:uncharacterized protein LOC126576743 [Anopheles aquasalis]|uniref:uncharacterized protein LOC126576743 n=1 Tax=Anopheles aquasalis TaxID=42839 RepID=UPI00215B5F33|nr:uncharacterized protein LOC126576743 [Anopheles aquasalis]